MVAELPATLNVCSLCDLSIIILVVSLFGCESRILLFPGDYLTLTFLRTKQCLISERMIAVPFLIYIGVLKSLFVLTF